MLAALCARKRSACACACALSRSFLNATVTAVGTLNVAALASACAIAAALAWPSRRSLNHDRQARKVLPRRHGRAPTHRSVSRLPFCTELALARRRGAKEALAGAKHGQAHAGDRAPHAPQLERRVDARPRRR